MALTRRTGVRKIRTVLAGATFTKGQAVQMDEATGSNTAIAAVTNTPIAGITTAAITSAATGDIDLMAPGDEFLADISSGTMAAASVGKYCDLAGSGASVTLTATNNDYRIVGWDGVNTAQCYITPTSPESATPTAII